MGIYFFSFSTLNISCHYLLSFKVSAYKSANSPMGVPLHLRSCFSLAALKILSMLQINYNVSSCGPPWVHFLWNSGLPRSGMSVSFPRMGKFLAIISLNKLAVPFSFSSSGIPIMQILVYFWYLMNSLSCLHPFSLFFFLFL